MRIAEVIGTVTLSRAHPSLRRSRWIVGVPYSLQALQVEPRAGGVSAPVADGEDVVIFDNLGAGNGQRIGFTEGSEAAAPFYPERKPVDAYCACIIDQLFTKPL